ncbi:MAG: fimbrillin family protein [Rikenellaceae bacterium]|jgi:hypothetical protein|nr:fimbrillin family protein [Rikenellaceae bacterium]
MKNSKTYSVLLAIAASVLASCGKESWPGPEDNETALFTLATPLIATGDTAAMEDDTRFVFDQGHFNSGSTDNRTYVYIHNVSSDKPWHEIGLSLMTENSTSVPHMNGYSNLFTRLIRRDPVNYEYDYNKWEALLQNGNFYEQIPVYKNKGKIDIYGYYPYNPFVTDITAIPFDVSAVEQYNSNKTGSTDYLWVAKKGVNPQDPAQLATGTITFNHVMAWLNLQFTIEVGGGLLYVRKVRLETVDGGAWLPRRGTFNATNGVCTTTDMVSELESICGFQLYRYIYNGVNWTYSTYHVNFVLPEIAVASASVTNRKLKVTVYFNLNEDETTPQFSDPFIIDLATLQTSNGDRGLRTGYRYNLPIKCLDYIKFINFDVLSVVPWGSEDIDIQI